MKVRVKLVAVFFYGNSCPNRVESIILQMLRQVCVPAGDSSAEKVSDIISAHAPRPVVM